MAAMTLLRLCAAALVLIALASVAGAQNPYGGRAPNVLVMDHNTGQILYEVNADIPLPPASMSKLVTLEMLFEALDQGRVQMDSTWSVSARAHAMGGSRMFLERRDRPTTEDLIRGIAVLSGNDASVVVAEGLYGTEEAYAVAATDRMRAMGMANTTIINSSGWPHPDHRMSLRDLAILARYMINTFPQYYAYLAEREFTWNNITQPNRVPLLTAGVGLDGLKTGHTNEAGFALTGSAVQGDRRVVFVFSGLETAAQRVEEAERIISWAFRSFAERRLAEPGQVIGQAEVWMGSVTRVDLVVPQGVRVLVPVLAQAGAMPARIEYDGPLAAPIAQGQTVARLVVAVPGFGEASFPLVAATEVPEGGLMARLRSAAVVLGEQLGFVGP
jgi:serine-type D-Ala-D-Ala carboxypeptidase (penicillin-binding protein 5/6)